MGTFCLTQFKRLKKIKVVAGSLGNILFIRHSKFENENKVMIYGMFTKYK